MVKRSIGALGQLVVAIVGITLLAFGLSVLAPGDPALLLLQQGGGVVAAESLTRARIELGLDQPFLVRYWQWLAAALHGDLGVSFASGRPVAQLYATALPATLLVSGITLALIVLVFLPLGVAAGLAQRRWLRAVCAGIGSIATSIPAFLVGLGLLYVFGFYLHVVPIARPQLTVPHALIVALALALSPGAKLMRQVEVLTADELRQGYLTGAQALGKSRWQLLTWHLLPNLAAPVLNLLSLTLGWLLAGVPAVEAVFNWPGIGTLALTAMLQRDYPVIQSFVLLVAGAFLVCATGLAAVARLLDRQAGAHV